MRVASTLYALLLDGKPRRLRDILPLLVTAVPPNIAVRCYLAAIMDNRKKKEAPVTTSLDRQLKLGSRRSVLQSIRNMAKQGRISLLKEGDRSEDFIVQLTPAQTAKIKAPTIRGDITGAWACLKKLYREGKVSIDITLNNGDQSCNGSS